MALMLSWTLLLVLGSWVYTELCGFAHTWGMDSCMHMTDLDAVSYLGHDMVLHNNM